MPTLEIYFADNLDVLRALPDAAVELIYIDPPFNTGRTQRKTSIAVESDLDGDRVGFGGRTYRTIRLGSREYADWFDDYLAFLEPRLIEARRVLRPDGSLILHLDYREVHYAKILMDQIFGRASFMNEIIWAYDYGARTKSRWPAKHDNLLWYARDPRNYVFNLDASDRIPYLAPGLVGPEKAARGKTPTDVWWHTIVSPTGSEKTGYPTQKPRGILDRIVKVHSRPGARVMDFFAGSGSFGESAWSLGRDCVLVDNHPQALETMQKRFAHIPVLWHGWNINRNRHS